MASRGTVQRQLVARHSERRLFAEALASDQPELVTVYGRRRVGKTFLIREALAGETCFELVGMHDVPLATQLRAFATALAKADGGRERPRPIDWHLAFEQLSQFLEPRLRRARGKQVVFFDEVPWLASRRSGFLPAFEYFWNAWASRQPKLVVVLCGSAASWMLENIVRQRGGLHHRVTRRVRVDPFSLADTEELLLSRGVELSRYQVCELAMALGGIPHYLAQVRRGESAAQAIDRLCFARDGLLRDEFTELFASLFEQHERHEAVVRALASHRRGLGRTALLEAAGLDSGGAASRVLDELEEAGFVLQVPRLGRTVRESVWWLADEFSLFHLTWIARHRSSSADGVWLRKQGTPAWRAWSGLAFEALCLKHVPAIKAALGIAAVDTTQGSWERRGTCTEPGAQIDLVIDRADRSTNLCEIKFAEGQYVLDKATAAEWRTKRDVFREATGTSRSLFVTLITTHGLRDNEHARGLVGQVVTLDALFAKRATSP
ncbi:MAG: hypothetical protein U0228_29160 [Myxococcaceae bacterium]